MISSTAKIIWYYIKLKSRQWWVRNIYPFLWKHETKLMGIALYLHNHKFLMKPMYLWRHLCPPLHLFVFHYVTWYEVGMYIREAIMEYAEEINYYPAEMDMLDNNKLLPPADIFVAFNEHTPGSDKIILDRVEKNQVDHHNKQMRDLETRLRRHKEYLEWLLRMFGL